MRELEEHTMGIKKEAMRPESMVKMRPSLKMHSENFADFKEEVMDKMEQKADIESQTEFSEVLKSTTSPPLPEIPNATILPNLIHLDVDPSLNAILDDQVPTQGPVNPDDDVELVTIPSTKTNLGFDKKHLRKGGHPGVKIKEITDPAVAKKLQRFTSAPSSSSVNTRGNTRRPSSAGRPRSRVRASPTSETNAVSTDDANHKEDVENTEEAGGRKRLRRPPSLSAVVRHRFRGSEKSTRKTGGASPPLAARRQRTRTRQRVEGDDIEKEEDTEEKEKEKVPMRLRPGRVRSRHVVGQSSKKVSEQIESSNSETETKNTARTVNTRRTEISARAGHIGRTGRPQRTRTGKPRSPVSRVANRVRQSIGGRSTSEATLTTTTTTPTTTATTTTTTTTEKVTINPNAHKIIYTLDDQPEPFDDLDDVIIELPHDTEYPDYIVEVPEPQPLRSSIPVPKDVFSQATHHLMKNHKKIPGLTNPRFRPTLLPRRIFTSPEPPTAPVFKATTMEEPEITVTEVIREFVQDTIEKEAMTAIDSVTVATKVETTTTQPTVKRGRFVLAIGANG